MPYTMPTDAKLEERRAMVRIVKRESAEESPVGFVFEGIAACELVP